MSFATKTVILQKQNTDPQNFMIKDKYNTSVVFIEDRKISTLGSTIPMERWTQRVGIFQFKLNTNDQFYFLHTIQFYNLAMILYFTTLLIISLSQTWGRKNWLETWEINFVFFILYWKLSQRWEIDFAYSQSIPRLFDLFIIWHIFSATVIPAFFFRKKGYINFVSKSVCCPSVHHVSCKCISS